MSERKEDALPPRISRREDGESGEIDPWDLIRWRVREGEDPEGWALVEAMESGPIPADLHRYVVDRAANGLDRGRGNPGNSRAEREGAHFRAWSLQWEVYARARQLAGEGRSAPVKDARSEVASRHHMSEQTLRNKIRNALDSETRARIRRWARGGPTK